MSNFEDSIAHKAHGLVHGDRAKDYGHPRFDFTAIGKVWTGLMQDLLKEDAVIDPYRVAVLMTGLKLCRLVKSPGHHDSRVDTIGYMLTMERLDEPEDDWVERKGFPPGTFDYAEDAPVPGSLGGGPQLQFSQVSVWFEPGESKWINGSEYKNVEECGKLIVFPFVGGTDVTISPHPPAKPTGLLRGFTCDECGNKFYAPRAVDGIQRENCPKCGALVKFEQVLNPLTGKPLGPNEVVASLDPRSEIEKIQEKDNIERVKRVHSHEFEAPCIPGCPVWEIENRHRPMFEFTGEQVKMERPDTRPGGGL